MDKAAGQYRAALKARPGEAGVLRAAAAFSLRAGSLADAEPLLRGLIAGKARAAADDVAWARRTLALALAGTRDPRRLPEALALVGLRLDGRRVLAAELAAGAAAGADEDVARARVLASQGRRPFQARAAALLEGVARQQPLSPDDQLLLAQLYLARGKQDLWWGKAREQLKQLVTTQAGNPAYLAFYARALADHDATQEAEQVLDRLEKLEKARGVPAAEVVSVGLRAAALEKAGRGAQALALLERQARTPGVPPEKLLLCAGLHGRLGDLGKALDVCERARSNCALEVVTGTALNLLRDARTKEKSAAASASWRQQASRAEGWLKAALKADPGKGLLRLQLADLLDLAGRAAEAEPLYREVLRQDDKNAVALNNLAWLLAQQPGKGEEALALINRAVGLYGAQAELLDTRGVVYLALGRSGPAVADLRRAVADSPTPSSYFHLVRAHHQARDRRAALAALDEAGAAGLSAERLHPSEREIYQRVVAELRQR
jgi:Tfp pilus assembly protein PilF